MKFRNAVFLGAVLALTTPFALADTISGTLVVNGAGSGGAAVNAANLAFTSTPSPGQVVSSTGTLGNDPAGAAVSFNSTDNNNNLKFANVSATHPILLLTSGGFKVYITGVSNIVPGVGGHVNPTKGSFDAVGYVTDDNGLTTTPITVTWLSSTTGAGKVAFTATIFSSAPITPEPSSLALLGTGVLGITGALRRRKVSNT